MWDNNIESYLVFPVNPIKRKTLTNYINNRKKYYSNLSKSEAAPHSNVKISKNNIFLTSEQEQIMIGSLLADESLERRKLNHNARLRIDHTYPKQEKYVKHLYEKFQNLTGKAPKIVIRSPDKRTGKVYKSLTFKTLNLPCLNYYHNLFYKLETEKENNIKRKFIKIVPNNIESLLTPISLAHWLMGDGYIIQDKAIIFCTESFNNTEIELLIKALHNKFGIESSKHKRQTKCNEPRWRIRINFKNTNKFKLLVSDYVIAEMLYKLGNKNIINNI